MKVLFNYKELTLSIKRLCFELIENHLSFDDTVIVGLQPRGKFFAKKIHEILSKEFLIKNLNIGYLDITFYRDDFRKKKAYCIC
jgi:pyrimidine operon attenuation protein/uracil phosphoribosyltransferase